MYQQQYQPPPPQAAPQGQTQEYYPRPLKIYRSKNAFDINIDAKIGKSLFIAGALSAGKDNNGNTRYDWDNKITIALNTSEAAGLIHYIETCMLMYYTGNYGRTDVRFDPSKSYSSSANSEGIFHKNKHGHSVLHFKSGINIDKGNALFFSITINVKRGQNTHSVTTALSVTDATYIKQMLKKFISVHHNWELVNEQIPNNTQGYS